MKKQKQSNKLKNITIAYGYCLFAFSLLALILGTVIPLGAIYFDPNSLHFNVAIFLISLTASAILPPLLSYIIGDRATHTKNKINHHFNGVLFGVAAYWVSLFFSFIMSETVATVRNNFAEPYATIINGWPIVATIVVMAVVAFSYAHHQKQGSTVLEYKPYQIVLFGGFVSIFLYSLVNRYLYADSNMVVSTLSMVVPAAIVAVSYWQLSQYGPTKSARLTIALIATSIGYISVSLAAQLIADPSPNMFGAVAVGAGSMVTYLLLIRRG